MVTILQQSLPGSLNYLFISSVTGYNIDKLKDKLWQMLNRDE
jgi:ribosome-interacting GTPase 1